MNMYVIADNNWGITFHGKPFVSIPAEKKSRLQEIAGKVIVYDLNYLNELPGQQALKGAVNIIFTDGQDVKVKDAKVFKTIDEVRAEVKKYPSEEVYIISDENLYKAFLADADVVHVTKIDYSYEADAFFENLDKNPDFKIVADSDEQYCFDIVYSFLKYKRLT